jgi:hypothetical protein
MAALPHLGSFSGQQWVRESLGFFSRPFQILRAYRRENLRPDLIAGLAIAAVLLPHSIAYALLAELPPQFGLYTAIVGALWGSSAHLHTGPTNALSLLVLSSLLPLVASGTPQFLAAAGLMAVMVGVAQIVMGIARLGVLVNFVSRAKFIQRPRYRPGVPDGSSQPPCRRDFAGYGVLPCFQPGGGNARLGGGGVSDIIPLMLQKIFLPPINSPKK